MGVRLITSFAAPRFYTHKASHCYGSSIGTTGMTVTPHKTVVSCLCAFPQHAMHIMTLHCFNRFVVVSYSSAPIHPNVQCTAYAYAGVFIYIPYAYKEIVRLLCGARSLKFDV